MRLLAAIRLLVVLLALSPAVSIAKTGTHHSFKHKLMQARKALTHASPNATLTVVHVPQEGQSGYEILGCLNCDCHVCQLVEKYKTFAPVETLVFKHILRDEGGCKADGDSTGLVVDIGCNIGYFSIYALYLGCHVVSFDPNRYARLLLAASAALHGHDELLHVLPYAIGRNVSHGILEHDVRGWAFQGIHDINDMGNGTVGQVTGTVLGNDEDTDDLRIIPLDLAIKRDVILLKIDTEGYELNVFEGSWKVLDQHDVQNVLVEVKNWTTTEKRDLLAKVLEVGKFERVYNYKEWYNSVLLDVSLERAFVDVTEVVRTKAGEMKYEDFLFRKAPLPKELIGDTWPLFPSPRVEQQHLKQQQQQSLPQAQQVHASQQQQVAGGVKNESVVVHGSQQHGAEGTSKGKVVQESDPSQQQSSVPAPSPGLPQ